MLEAFEIESGDGSAQVTVVLSFEERQKSRHRTQTVCGRELGWFIERGRVLASDDILVCRDGTRVQVEAARETVSLVESVDQLALTRVAYHLGNRHVPLQIEAGRLCYLHDHVLDAMVQGLGLEVACIDRPFNPENGAYHSHGVAQAAGHSHQSTHEHSIGHAHSHGVNHSHRHGDTDGNGDINSHTDTDDQRDQSTHSPA